MNIMRPDYKAGDAEFDDDVRIINLGHDHIFGETNALVALELIARYAGAAERQLIYWRNQAEYNSDKSPILRAAVKVRMQHEAALETIASMARTIEKLTHATPPTD